MDKRENMSLAELRAEKAHLNKKMQALAKELFEAADDDEAKLNKYEELKAEYVAVENLIGAQTDGSTFNGHYHEKTSELSFRGVPVTIIFDIEAGQHHLAEDFIECSMVYGRGYQNKKFNFDICVFSGSYVVNFIYK